MATLITLPAEVLQRIIHYSNTPRPPSNLQSSQLPPQCHSFANLSQHSIPRSYGWSVSWAQTPRWQQLQHRHQKSQESRAVPWKFHHLTHANHGGHITMGSRIRWHSEERYLEHSAVHRSRIDQISLRFTGIGSDHTQAVYCYFNLYAIPILRHFQIHRSSTRCFRCRRLHTLRYINVKDYRCCLKFEFDQVGITLLCRVSWTARWKSETGLFIPLAMCWRPIPCLDVGEEFHIQHYNRIISASTMILWHIQTSQVVE